MPPVTHAYRAYRRVTLKRSALMLSSAVAALAAQPAHGQVAGAFRGDISSTTGTVTRLPTTNTTETITIGSNTAVAPMTIPPGL